MPTPGREPYVLGLVAHPRNDVSESVATVTRAAARHGSPVVARPSDAARLGDGVLAMDDHEFVERVDAVISLGGDGTMLGAMRLMAGRQTPVLGVNHGNLGFLIEVSPAQLPAALDEMVNGRFSLEPHCCLEVEGDAGPTTAFNDIVLAGEHPGTTANLDLEINDVRHGYYRCDAVVACTPTGSTAYNYAAGGPIISPSTPAIGLTPVAPMSGISRTIVLGGEDVVTLRNPSERAALRMSLDGAAVRRVEPRGHVTLRLRPDVVNVVRFDPAALGQRNRVKLSLLDLPLRPDQLLELVPEHLRERARQLRREGTLLS
ncbi:NAD(+)/NADH kinase [Micromonospora sp. NBC_01655]|uniref:NAD(+)/NADH kinase n=1 Tax=unclassified Micromonospora TaxID=2617518 RepID=UPI001A9EE7F0|nr:MULTISPECIES: NAD(+)/NADH kinase [unclassified Micromonospora]MCX4471245.1 NAD(+)/NADH kinase [Micromonospora sp. NBC_01655]